jgi:tripartite-type tricarboxylate transporter receptor subunit TctC
MTRLLTLTLACAATLSLAAPAAAQDYPNQPIKLIVAFGPGGGSDIVSRIIAERMQTKLGQPMVIENKPGAGGTIGNEIVARAAPDGYTIGIMTAGQIISAAMIKNMRYDTRTAFDPIAMIATAGLMIAVRPDAPYNSVKDLVEAAKASPGKLVFGAAGFGATQHMAAEMFKQVAGVNMLHVPFRTTPEAITALLGKQIDVVFETVSGVLGQVQGGQMKALAVTGKDRFPAVPNIPAAIESGVTPGYDVTTWYGFFGPKGMPPAVIAKLNKAFVEVIEEPAVREKLTAAGVVVKGTTAAEFGKFMDAELTRWNAVREKAGLEQR